MRANLEYSASDHWLGLGSSGDVVVSGTVYNYGSSSCLTTLNLGIFDGYVRHCYSDLLGQITGNGGFVYFYNIYYFSNMDSDSVNVQYELVGE